MRWKTFQWIKFLFSHSSNYSRKLSRPKFHNELACVHCSLCKQRCRLKSTTTNGWRHFGQSEQRKSSIFFPIQSERGPDSGFFACDLWKDCIMPSSRKQITVIKGEEWFRGSFFLANQLSKVAIHVWQTRVHFCSNVILPWKLRCLCLCCLVPVRRLSRPSRSMHFGDICETNARETHRQSWSANAWAFLHFWKVHTVNWNNL